MNGSIVICLGEVLYDYIAMESGKAENEVTSWAAFPGGAPANVACALANLGTKSTFIGCVGEDAPGSELIKVLAARGVDVSGIQRHKIAPTPKVYVLRNEKGDRTFAGFGGCLPENFAHAYINAELLSPSFFETPQEKLSFLVMGSLCYAYVESKKAIDRALSLAKLHNIKVVLDVNWRPMFWPVTSEAPALIKELLEKSDLIKFSEEEAQWLFSTKSASEIFAFLPQAEGIIVTAGEGMVNYCFREISGEVKAFSLESIDTTGAGDSFLAGFLHQISKENIAHLKSPEKVKEMIIYACAVGGLTTLKHGAIAAQPSEAEVEAFLRGSI